MGWKWPGMVRRWSRWVLGARGRFRTVAESRPRPAAFPSAPFDGRRLPLAQVTGHDGDENHGSHGNVPAAIGDLGAVERVPLPVVAPDDPQAGVRIELLDHAPQLSPLKSSAELAAMPLS